MKDNHQISIKEVSDEGHEVRDNRQEKADGNMYPKSQLVIELLGYVVGINFPYSLIRFFQKSLFGHC